MLQYDPKRPLLMLLRWRGTTFQSVVANPVFWFLVAINCTLTVLRFKGNLLEHHHPEINEKFITLLGSLLVWKRGLESNMATRSPCCISLGRSFCTCCSLPKRISEI